MTFHRYFRGLARAANIKANLALDKGPGAGITVTPYLCAKVGCPELTWEPFRFCEGHADAELDG